MLTAEELERISIPGKVTELIRGRLIVREPPGTWHGASSAKLRAPDVAFVARERVGVIRERGYAELAPDLLAEVLSPDDRPAEVLAKVADWLAAGTKIFWVVDPERREARVHRQDGSLSILGNDDSLDGEDVLPGLTCPLQDVLKP